MAIKADAEIELRGEFRAHQCRFDFSVHLEHGEIEIEDGFVQRERADGRMVERSMPDAILDRLRADRRFMEWAFENTLAGFPNA